MTTQRRLSLVAFLFERHHLLPTNSPYISMENRYLEFNKHVLEEISHNFSIIRYNYALKRRRCTTRCKLRLHEAVSRFTGPQPFGATVCFFLCFFGKKIHLGGGFKYFFSPLPGEMIQFD